jgi:hypothetical protein
VAPYLTLDFNAAPATRFVRYAVLGLGILALLASGTGLVAAWSARAEAQSELASLERRGPGRPASSRTPVDAATIRAVSAIARDLRAPWPELMRSMEASSSGDISLLQVEPVVASDSIRITADARHADAMLDYLAQLKAQGLSAIVLNSHEIRLQEPGRPIRFQAQARWVGLKPRPGAVLAEAPMSPEAPPASGGDLTALQRYIESERSAR